ncbi:hypothetical protein MOQ_005745 [Trypanosoma cruzi marinkellei]|uniref:Trichohyalin-plectin-homology domain-containing protein n=1 Tax=Trypanosoma cruzi marinkellei TaxID=85056 RepID=K2M680_TRYCR|nr:hypothetical protein MOQ_005745 [Trypanosoma cruzi marinkellei]
MSQHEFSLLSHLGVSVPEVPSRAMQTNNNRDGNYRVLAPCMRPPVKGAIAPQVISPRRVPSVPLADYTGEVMMVKGKGGRPNTEYLIYNARVPCIRAVNLQLMKERRRQCKEEAVSRMSPDTFLIQTRERDELARRRLLEHLQHINREQAQRKVEEKERERQRRLEVEVAEIKAVKEVAAKEAAALVIKKQAERQAMQRDLLDAMERKKQEAADVNNHLALECAAFPWDNAPPNEAKRREMCLSLLDANQKLAEEKKMERRARQMEERARDLAALEAVRAEMEREERRALEKKRYLCEERQRSGMGTSVKAAPVVIETSDLGSEWFLRTTREDAGVRRERQRELMEANKRLAEETRKRRAEEVERQIQQEREVLQEAERAYKQRVEWDWAEKRKQQDALQKEAQKTAAERHEKKRISNEDDSCLFLFQDSCRKAEKERQRREQLYCEELKRGVDMARESRREAKEREAMQEKKYLEMQGVEARRVLEREREKALEKRETYRRELEEQIQSKKTKTAYQAPVTRRGSVMKVLYRCPVTGDLLPPDQFGISSVRQRQSGWI